MSSATAPQTARRRPSLRRVFALCGLLLLALMLPKIWLSIPEEISRWYLAGAMEHNLAGEFERVEPLLERAREWDPDNVSIDYFASQFLVERGRPWEALQVLRGFHQRRPPTITSLQRRADAYQRLGQHQLAIEDWQSTIRKVASVVAPDHRDFPQIVAHQRNGTAYAMAVGGRGLDTARTYINQAIAAAGGEAVVADPKAIRQLYECELLRRKAHSTFFTRRSAFAEAGKAIDRLVSHVETRLAAVKPLEKSHPARYRDYRVYAAGIYRYRARFAQELGDMERAAADRKVIEEQLKLNYDEVNTRLLMPRMAFESLAAFLDTRGWVYYHQHESEKALQDLNDALLMYGLAEAEKQKAQPNVVAVDLRRHQENQKRMAHSRAVTHYHRGKTHERLGNTDAANKDFRRVRELGFEPTEELY